MDAILALMPETGQMLASPGAAGALHRVFAAVRDAVGLDRVLAVGQDPGLLALAEVAGLSTVSLAAQPARHPAGLLPAGGAEALSRLAADGRRVLLVSCENPLLTPEVIDAFVRQAARADRPTLSVKAPVDHPCQLSQHLRMREAGVVLPLDRQASDGGARLLTRPFRFLWFAQQAQGQGPAFVFDSTAPGSSGSALLSVPDRAALPARGPLLLRESDDRARLSLCLDEAQEAAARLGLRPDEELCGLGLHLSAGLPSVAFRAADGALGLGFAWGGGGRALCQLYGRDGQGAEHHASLDLEQALPRVAAPRELCGPDGLHGPLYYSLLEYLDDDGGFDLTLPYPASHGLWSVDRASGCRINACTGRRIHGRQEFPEVFEPDGSLFALTRGEAEGLEPLLFAGEVAAFVLQQTQSLRLRTEFDLLRYKAKLRAEGI